MYIYLGNICILIKLSPACALECSMTGLCNKGALSEFNAHLIMSGKRKIGRVTGANGVCNDIKSVAIRKLFIDSDGGKGKPSEFFLSFKCFVVIKGSLRSIDAGSIICEVLLSLVA